MVIYTHNPFAGPLVLLIWLIDVFLLIVMTRLVMESLTIQLNSALYRHIRQITGPVLTVVHRWVRRIHHRAPTWLCWVLIYISALFLRCLLIVLLHA